MEKINCKNCKASSDKFIEDHSAGDIICTQCGVVIDSRLMYDGPEWSNYENDRESGRDNSRVTWTDPSNPYSQLGGSMPNLFVKVKNDKGETITVNLKKVHTIVSSNPKERAFYEIIKFFNSLVYEQHFNQRTVDLAKVYWNELVKTKRIFRGGNRKGIIACCLLYASNKTSTTKTKEEIASIMNISKDDIVKGEPIFIDIIAKSKHSSILDSSNKINNMFSPIILELNLPYKYIKECQNLYQQCQEELSEISSPAAIAGIVSYLVHTIKKLKKPTKKQIIQTVNITNPTLTNAVKIIKESSILLSPINGHL